jgi:hypothetical protein
LWSLGPKSGPKKPVNGTLSYRFPERTLSQRARRNQGEKHEGTTGLDRRHRDKNGEISKKHGNTLVGTLRKIYGSTFAAGQPDSAKLSDVLEHLNETSLSELVHDHRNGKLEKKVRQAASDQV